MVQRTARDKKPLNSMKLTLKKLDEQVIVLTGATSGIGLVTARMAAKTGAKLVISGTDEEALQTLTEELKENGTEVVYVKTDVSKEEDVDRLAEKAIEAFGGFDTWINNAAAALYGHMTDIPIEEARKLFETNYWGTVYGSLAAVRHFKEKDEPGAIINLGSILGNRTFPLQGTYSSTKHAVHSFTEALRMEAEKDHLPIVVSEIHPARVDTPYPQHAASYLKEAPSHDGMMYPPESVAEAILHAAEQPVRDIYVGGQSKMLSVMGALMPRVTDRYLERSIYKTNYDESQKADPPEESILHGRGEELHERGSNAGWTRKGSWMVKAKKHPVLAALAAAFGILSIGFLIAGCVTAMSGKQAKKHHAKRMMHMKKKKMMLKHPKAHFAKKHPKMAFKMMKKHFV